MEHYNEDTKIITVPDNNVSIHQGGLGGCFFEKMKGFSDRIYQIDAVTGEEETYASFLDRCIKTAEKMKSMGLKPGDIISICSNNNIDNSVPLVAALFSGILVASLDPTISQEDTNYLMGIVNPKMVFVCQGSEVLIQNGIDHLGIQSTVVVFGESNEFMQFKEFYKFECNVDDFKPRVPESVDDVAIILFSSGTTGLPKGICLNHKVFLQACQVDIPGIYFVYASLYWLSAHTFTYTVIMNGKTKVVNLKFDLETAWHSFHKYKMCIWSAISSLSIPTVVIIL